MGTGTVADIPGLLQPMQDAFLKLRENLVKELNTDPVPQFSSEQIRSTTQWLLSATEAMREEMDCYTPQGLRALDDAALERFSAQIRESALRLSLLHSDSSKHFGGRQAEGTIVFSERAQSEGMRSKLQEFASFLQTFAESKWLGDMVAPEFATQKATAIAVLNALQKPTQPPALPKQPYAVGRQLRRAISDHAQPTGERANSFYDDVTLSANTGEEQLNRLADMAIAFARACQEDAHAHGQKMDAIQQKMQQLRDFIQAVAEVPKALRRFVLLRLDSIDDYSLLKSWVSQQEATDALQQLEQLRDWAVEERVVRRVAARGARAAPYPAS
mmetsp:Transcript_93545/g.260477  ORF Transcript_93545/g.260477 Transcript_93545/m.260477 type:complete len:330 (+) Transcript_93545:61-1050(+)